MRVGACLGAWLVVLGHWGDLGAFARELARLKTKELPHLPLQLLASKLYRLYRSAQKYKIVHILAIWYDFEWTKQSHLRLKPKHMRVACRDTLDTKETLGVKKI